VPLKLANKSGDDCARFPPRNNDANERPETLQSFARNLLDGAEEERKLIAAGKLPAETARFPFVDVDTGKQAGFGMGSIAWNSYRKRWIMIAIVWGDVYYSEVFAP
jgi:hypothetical protein